MISQFIFTVLILVMLYFFANFNQIKLNFIGWQGEQKVRKNLKLLDSSYKIRNNVRHRGYQIDHVVSKGNIVFVIETKNWHGIVQGKSTNKYITLNHKKILNPIYQNEYHCRALRLDYREPIFLVVNVICLVGSCRFNVTGIKNCCCKIVRLDEILAFITLTENYKEAD